jgi:hypothetical protein
MEKKGKFPCRSPVCSVFVGDHGRARRRSWTSSLGCSASTHSRAPWTRKRRRQLTTTPCTTPGRPRAHIRTKVLLCHILEAPLHGRVGIDIHLGQKPKLGGRYADDSLIYISYFVGTLYIHVSFSFFFFVALVLISTFQNTKRPKIFPLFLFVYFFSSLALVCFVSYFWFVIRKSKKILLCLLFSFCSCFKIQKPKNICCSSSVL